MSPATDSHVKRKSLAGPLIKSIIFILVTAIATAILGLSIANTAVTNSVSYNAMFTDVTGLTVGSDVDIAGVRVGQVNQISVVDRNLALVGFSVQRSRPLPVSVTATILYLNLVGQRYIELAQGAGPVDQTLRADSTIPLSHTTPALDLTELFDGFQPLFQALSPSDVNQLSGEIVQVLQGEGGTMQSLVANIGSLTTTVAAKDEVIDEVIGNLNSVLHTVNSRGSALSDLVTTVQELVSGLAADRQPIGSAISAISQLTTATAGLLQVGRAPLKQDIIQLGRLSSNLAASTPTLNTFLHNLPIKMTDIARLASYGSWLNFYMCDATLTGAKSSYGGAPPTGIGITAARCKG
jgi:phospholipid/cholesterol/gamma-HCH transport system substrate-binding protein